jgi:hypothetical protein
MQRRQFLSTIGLGAGAIAMPSLARAVTPANRPNDIALLREILATLHPGLYRYASPKGIEAGLTSLGQSWPKTDMKGRYLSLMRFLATIKCGHSYPNFYNQSKAVKAALFEGDAPHRLPFAYRWIGDQMVVTQQQAPEVKIPVGSIITRVNGIAPPRILRGLLPYVRADGSNDGKRRALLSVSGADAYETGDVLAGLLYGPPKSGRFKIDYRNPISGVMADTEVQPITWAMRKSFMRQSDSSQSDAPLWDWQMRDEGIAVLTMDSWALYNSQWKWQDWLDDRLSSLKGAKGLIVDIRENEGGLDCGDAILARFADKDIVKPKTRRLVRYQKVPAHLNAYLDTWDDSFRDWGDKVRRYDDRFFERVGASADPVIAAKGPRIDVPLIVLTSAQNSSATFAFASLCRASKLAMLVGEETGGNQRGINGGSFFFARLPESGIEFDVPLIGYFPEGPMQKDRGLSPSVVTATTAMDIYAGRDAAMDYAVEEILR